MMPPARRTSSATDLARDAEERRIESAYSRRAALHSRYAWTNPGHLFLVQQVERALLRRLGAEQRDLALARVLEVGCGSGYWLRQLCTWGAAPARVTGIDLLPERIDAARALCPPAVTLRCASAADIGDPDGSYDLVFQFTTFTSIQNVELKQRIAREMLRVLAPGGVIVWYDFFRNNPRNPDVRGIGKRELRSLFPDCDVSVERVTLAPPLARALAPWSWTACHLLQAVPLLRTHYLATIRRPSGRTDDARPTTSA